MSSSSTPRQRPPRQPPPPTTNPPHMIPQQSYYPQMPMNPQPPSQFQPPNPYQHFQAPPQNESQLIPQPQPHPQSQPQSIPQSNRKRKPPGSAPMAGMSTMSPSGLGESGGVGQQLETAPDASPTMSAPKKSRTNTPWSPVEEHRLRVMRDAGNSWGEIAKSFPARTEGSVKKHWYKDMHYADFAENESQALLNAIKEYEASKWKVIGQKVGKPAKACEQYAKEHFQGKS